MQSGHDGRSLMDLQYRSSFFLRTRYWSRYRSSRYQDLTLHPRYRNRLRIDSIEQYPHEYRPDKDRSASSGLINQDVDESWQFARRCRRYAGCFPRFRTEDRRGGDKGTSTCCASRDISGDVLLLHVPPANRDGSDGVCSKQQMSEKRWGTYRLLITPSSSPKQ